MKELDFRRGYDDTYTARIGNGNKYFISLNYARGVYEIYYNGNIIGIDETQRGALEAAQGHFEQFFNKFSTKNLKKADEVKVGETIFAEWDFDTRQHLSLPENNSEVKVERISLDPDKDEIVFIDSNSNTFAVKSNHLLYAWI